MDRLDWTGRIGAALDLLFRPAGSVDGAAWAGQAESGGGGTGGGGLIPSSLRISALTMALGEVSARLRADLDHRVPSDAIISTNRIFSGRLGREDATRRKSLIAS